MPKEQCINCQQEFEETAEELLLQALFGEGPWCKDCKEEARDAKFPKCSECGKPTDIGVMDKSSLFCPQCYSK